MSAQRIGFATSAKYRELAPSERLATEVLRERGCEVEPVVWTETEPSRVDCDVVVIRSVWDYHLDVERFLGWVDRVRERAVVLNAPETIRWNSDKRYLFDLQRTGLPVPKMVVIQRVSEVDVSRILKSHGFNEAVIKPAVSASAFETYRVNQGTAEAVQKRVRELLRSRTLLMQEFVPEISTQGEWSLMFFRGAYSHAVRKLPKPGDFRVQAEHGGGHVPDVPGETVRRVAHKVVGKFAAETLYARIDIVEGKASPLIMELELIDPELFLTSESAVTFVSAMLSTVRNRRTMV
ncbi:MAG: ATP-grasp domain-containing protein [Terriglobales bacterium]